MDVGQQSAQICVIYLEFFNQWEIISPSKIGNYFENFDGSA